MTVPQLPALFLSPAESCSYLPGRQANYVFADPRIDLDDATYARLVEYGFRRSGRLVYRPHCNGCHACRAVRVDVSGFRQRRAQRRTWQRNQDLVVREHDPVFNPEHFALYQRYQASRHRGGPMDDPDSSKYREFFLFPGLGARLYEFRTPGGELVCVAIGDQVRDGLSAMYTFFDPDAARRSPGTFAILWQIKTARDLGLDWLYLGYWVRDCRKMAYKSEFRPMEVLEDRRWRPLVEESTAH
ncbi:MAG: arginyltransferase [Gammaproteobacteria bacterium]|nr:arginyltransferase [Gammaproteobacteria bacterium]